MKPRPLKDFIREERGDVFPMLALVDAMASTRGFDVIFTEINKITLCHWINSYEEYVKSFIDPMTATNFRIECFIQSWEKIDGDEPRFLHSPRKVYIIRDFKSNKFMHSDGTAHDLTYHDGKPNGLFESKEEAEKVLCEHWSKYK